MSEYSTLSVTVLVSLGFLCAFAACRITLALCCTLSCTMGLISNSRSSIILLSVLCACEIVVSLVLQRNFRSLEIQCKDEATMYRYINLQSA